MGDFAGLIFSIILVGSVDRHLIVSFWFFSSFCLCFGSCFCDFVWFYCFVF